MLKNPKNISCADFRKVCEHYFGEPRQERSSHCVFKTAWQGNPRINIQNEKGKAKAYQVRQVLQAIDKLEVQNGNKTDNTD
ncbi:MAG TPA: toxin HicA [Dehalococcoidia bacterium]|nr:toxin HicA [Dehalococcoidia bacterium]